MATGSSLPENEDGMITDFGSKDGFLVDIGANLTNERFSKDLDDVVKRAMDAGVKKIMVTGSSLSSSKEALELARLYPGILYSTAGVHPHDAKMWDTETLQSIKDLILNNPECVAVGECGLDFNRNFSPQPTQIEVFEIQVQLACELQKPLFIHERDAHEDMVKMLTKYQSNLPPTVIHCFTGTKTEVLKYLEMGCYIGLTGFLWKDKSENGVRNILEEKIIPLDRLLVETDSPFMYPNARAKKLSAKIKNSLTTRSLDFLKQYCSFDRNEPCSLLTTIEMIAAFSGLKPEEISTKTSFNALKIFGLR